MAQLRQDYPEFASRQTEIIAIGPEDTKSFASWWQGERMPFTGIADPEHKVARMYSQPVKLMKLGRMPLLVLIDRQGRVRYRHDGESMSDIPANRDILPLLDELNREQT